MSAYLDQDNLHILLEDIRLYTLSPFPEQVVPVRTKVPVHPRDLKHYIWNIGIRLGTPVSTRQHSSSRCLLKNAPQPVTRNYSPYLRQDNKYLIELSHPNQEVPSPMTDNRPSKSSLTFVAFVAF
ncbi:MAG: hypothetical protein ACLTOV_13920 [Phocaeicola sp.]